MARKSKALLLPELKFQARLRVSPVLALMGEEVTESMALRAALLRGMVPEKDPEVCTESTEALTESARSVSTRVREPEAERMALVSLMAAAALSREPIEMAGVSLVPVMVTTTLCVAKAMAESLSSALME